MPYANGSHGNGNEATHKTIEYIDQKDGLINFGLRVFLNYTHHKFKHQKQRQNGLYDGPNTVIGQKRGIITTIEDFKKICDTKKVDNLIPKRFKNLHPFAVKSTI